MTAAARRTRDPEAADRRRWVVGLGLGLGLSLLSACATRGPAMPAPGSQAYSGRLSMRIAGSGTQGERAASLVFELRGRAEAGEIEFSTPLGSIVAQARWSPAQVLLITPQGEQAYPDLDSLSREALGEPFPLAALFDWLQGRPWPAAASQAEPGGQAFRQLGWRVDLADLAQARISAERTQAPAMRVQVLLDRP